MKISRCEIVILDEYNNSSLLDVSDINLVQGPKDRLNRKGDP